LAQLDSWAACGRVAIPFGDEGFRFIAPSRFGYLGTPLPDGAIAESQADAYLALFDHLAVDRVVVVGYSAGARPRSSSPFVTLIAPSL
jgi:pimeloyl-ACP methyl ester carboxylesterase